jgi:hypothetical protein
LIVAVAKRNKKKPAPRKPAPRAPAPRVEKAPESFAFDTKNAATPPNLNQKAPALTYRIAGTPVLPLTKKG